MKNVSKRRDRGLTKAAALGVAERIRGLRLRLDQPQERFASLVGVSRETVEAWELGQGIRRDDLVLIADRTGASLHWLIAGLTPERVEAIRARAARCVAALPAASRAGRPNGAATFASP